MTLEQLAFGICWYDDPSIIRLLRALPKQAAKYVIDGRFKWNPSKSPLSDTQLRRRVARFTNVKLIDAPDLLETEKRQKYFDAVADDHKKYCFVIDSDEYPIIADWNKFYDRCVSSLRSGIHSIPFKTPMGITLHPRLFVNPEDWAYYKCHCWWLHVKSGKIYKQATDQSGTFKSVVLGSDDLLRSESYLDNVKEYQKDLWAYEKPLRS